MDLTGLEIVVVGAGIGGLAAALALRQRGADVTVLEQAEAIREVGAGLQISPNGVAVMRALGLQDSLRARSDQAAAVVLKDYRRAGEILRLDLTRLATDQSYHFVHRSDLIDLMALAVRAAGVKIRLLQHVTSVQPGLRPEITLENGARKRADLVVAADGLHSIARPVLNAPSAPFFTGQVAWRTVVSNETGRGPVAQVHMAPHRHLVSYPLRQGALINLVAVQERAEWAEEGWAHIDDPRNMRVAFADFGPDALELLDRVEHVNLWGLFRHPVAANWQNDGVVLLGDAAHPTLPFLAQGANMALEDAWVLAASLSNARDVKDGLRAYQQRRRDRVVRVINAANGNAWKYHLSFPPLRAAAHLALKLGGAIAPDRMMHQFDWLYAHDVTRDVPDQRSRSIQTGT